MQTTPRVLRFSATGLLVASLVTVSAGGDAIKPEAVTMNPPSPQSPPATEQTRAEPAAVPVTAPVPSPAPSPRPLDPLTAAQQRQLTELVSRVKAEDVMDLIRLLPPQRSAGPTEEHADRLKLAQDTLLVRLKAMGYAPNTQPVPLRRPWELGASERASDSKTKSAAELGIHKRHEWLNIWVDLPGTDSDGGSSKANEVVLLAAHFDCVPQAPGADDNASGTAALLSIAEHLKKTPGLRHARTIRLAFFNHEELGLIGASRYQQAWREGAKASGEKIVGMVSMEMLGFFSTAPGSQRNPFKGMAGFPDLTVGDFLAICGSSKFRQFNSDLAGAMALAEPGLKTVVIDQFPNEQMAFVPPDLLRSDHQPFLLRDIPAVMLTDTANFRNKNYHQPTDAIDTLDAEALAKATRAMLGAAWILAKPVDEPIAPSVPSVPNTPTPEPKGK